MTKKCPLMGDCVEHQCRWFINVIGQHPQTGEHIDRWDCSITFIPMLLVENAKNVSTAVKSSEQLRETFVQVVKSSALGAQ
jgi:hypothetical protein